MTCLPNLLRSLRTSLFLCVLLCLASVVATSQDAAVTRPRRVNPAPVEKNASDANEAPSPAATEAAPPVASDDVLPRRDLAETLVREERFTEALPLLVALTGDAASSAVVDPSDARMRARLFALRGLAELRTGKIADAATSLDQAMRLDARNAPALFYRARLAFDAGELNRAVILLNRAVLVEPRFTDAWRLLAITYLRRAAETETAAPRTQTTQTQDAAASAAADRTSAIRASDGLLRAERTRPTSATVQLHAQALIAANQFARAAVALEVQIARIEPAAPEPATLYLLGVAHSRTKNYAQAIRRLEQAAARSADDPSIHAELGYAYEVTRAYPSALKAYRRAAELAPDDMELTSAVARVRPLVK